MAESRLNCMSNASSILMYLMKPSSPPTGLTLTPALSRPRAILGERAFNYRTPNVGMGRKERCNANSARMRD